MNIYVDESGSFVSAPNFGAWNVVVAYVSPEGEKRKLGECLRRLKLASGHSIHDEIKLRELGEALYLRFLKALSELAGVVFCTATDAGRNTPQAVSYHQREQVKSVSKDVDKMKYEGGREGLRLLAAQLETLSPQLYVQLQCQVDLFFDVISHSVIYFVQRRPNTLKRFRWRVDQKNSTKTDYEDAFEKTVPAVIQTRSIVEPMIFVKEFDYSTLERFMNDRPPEYLERDYGIKVGPGLDLGSILREDMEFVDSEDSPGIQIADFIASGIRRCMRLGFRDNLAVARALGGLMIQGRDGRPPLNLASFSGDAPIDSQTTSVVRAMTQAARPMILRQCQAKHGGRA